MSTWHVELGRMHQRLACIYAGKNVQAPLTHPARLSICSLAPLHVRTVPNGDKRTQLHGRGVIVGIVRCVGCDIGASCIVGCVGCDSGARVWIYTHEVVWVREVQAASGGQAEDGGLRSGLDTPQECGKLYKVTVEVEQVVPTPFTIMTAARGGGKRPHGHGHLTILY